MSSTQKKFTLCLLWAIFQWHGKKDVKLEDEKVKKKNSSNFFKTPFFCSANSIVTPRGDAGTINVSQKYVLKIAL
jgi:hypothetical protein